MSTLNCPRCAEAPSLREQSGAWSQAGCSSCGGNFLDATGAQALLETRLGLAPAFLRELAAMHGGPQLACPSCTRKMSPVPLRGVPVDLCTGCGGLWFDRGELAALARGLPGTEMVVAADHAPVREWPRRDDVARGLAVTQWPERTEVVVARPGFLEHGGGGTATSLFLVSLLGLVNPWAMVGGALAFLGGMHLVFQWPRQVLAQQGALVVPHRILGRLLRVLVTEGSFELDTFRVTSDSEDHVPKWALYLVHSGRRQQLAVTESRAAAQDLGRRLAARTGWRLREV